MSEPLTRLPPALPFWMSLTLVPLVGFVAFSGGWSLLLIPVYSYFLFGVLDLASGLSAQNPDISAEADLFYHKLITWIWLPIQTAMIFGVLWWVTRTDHLSDPEGLLLMVVVGVVAGAVGIVYAHELIHQRTRAERFLGECLMILALYGHFVTEHLKVHHVHVGTKRDAATARYNESFYAFFARVLVGSFRSAWSVEAQLQRRKGNPASHRSNPFWRYLSGAAVVLLVAYAIGGTWGVVLYLVMAFSAIMQLEQINYIEHYGLVRRPLKDAGFERVRPHHSWNAAHRFTNFLFINLQRHSDHHVAPSRPYPLLQTYSEFEAPQLPAGYPLMVLLSFNPFLWRRIMNPRVRRWRSMFYPEVTRWS